MQAAAACVSTRTLYNHFPGGKADLFRTVVTWTSSEVKDAQLGRLHALLDPERPPRPEDLERDLIVLARAFVGVMAESPDHFARPAHPRRGRPRAARGPWGMAGRRAGPGPVGRGLADAMAGLAAAGLIDVHGDAALTGVHFSALTSHQIVQQSHYSVRPLSKETTERLITRGVAAFLRAYRAA